MLNTGRVRLMSQMALIERKSGRKISRIINFSRRDYIGRALLVCLVLTTLFAMVIAGVAVLYLFLFQFSDLLEQWQEYLKIALVAYGVFLVVHLIFAFRRASREYRDGYRQLQALRDRMGDLNTLYNNEAQQTRSMVAVSEEQNGGAK